MTIPFDVFRSYLSLTPWLCLHLQQLVLDFVGWKLFALSRRDSDTNVLYCCQTPDLTCCVSEVPRSTENTFPNHSTVRGSCLTSLLTTIPEIQIEFAKWEASMWVKLVSQTMRSQSRIVHSEDTCDDSF